MKKSKKRHVMFVVFITFLMNVSAMVISANSAIAATSYYVSKNGNNSGGTSWINAWSELDQINWSNIHPGDTIHIDGGKTEMVYLSALHIGKSGTSDNRITIKLSEEPGKNGKVVIFGGRSIPLP
jgi:hypothetical protein